MDGGRPTEARSVILPNTPQRNRCRAPPLRGPRVR